MVELDEHEQDEGKKQLGRFFSRSVILMTCAVLLIVTASLFFLTHKTTQARSMKTPLPVEKTPLISPQEWNTRINDVGAILHPELASSTKNGSAGL